MLLIDTLALWHEVLGEVVEGKFYWKKKIANSIDSVDPASNCRFNNLCLNLTLGEQKAPWPDSYTDPYAQKSISCCTPA